MNVSYTQPLRNAWARMKRMLFRPFRLEAWLTIGLAAFLAELGSSSGGVGSTARFSTGKGRSGDLHVLDGVRDQLLHALTDPRWLLGIAVVLVFMAVLLLVIFWVGTRAQFIFLDNVVTGSVAFVEPWKRLGRLGRSLFLWLGVFSFAWLVPIACFLLPFVGALHGYFSGEGFRWPDVALMVFGAGLGVLFSLGLAFVQLLLHEFVVPLMYRYDENATQAWARFRPLLMSRFGDFFAFAIFLVVACIVVAVGVLVAGCATCCVGLLLLAIPYLGTVLLLPIEVTARGFGPEFLRQFGPEWDVFLAPDPPAPGKNVVP